MQHIKSNLRLQQLAEGTSPSEENLQEGVLWILKCMFHPQNQIIETSDIPDTGIERTSDIPDTGIERTAGFSQDLTIGRTGMIAH